MEKENLNCSFKSIRGCWVMTLAAYLQEEYSLDQSTALKKAHAAFDLLQELHMGVVEFAYLKADGTCRRARGTLKIGIDPFFDSYQYKSIQAVRENNCSGNICTYWDLDRHAFRTFKANNLVCYE